MKVLVHILLVSIFLFSPEILSAQGSMCEDIEPFCAGDQRLTFPNSNYTNSNQLYGETGPDYGCLEAQPYPAWFFLQIEEGGNLTFRISQFQNENGTGAPLDVDFIVWGPFERGKAYCNAESLSEENIVDCSYLPDAVETMSIPDAQANEIYVVLITNFQTEPGFISLEQTNTGGGSTDCTILDSDLGDSIVVCGEDNYVLDGTTDDAEVYEWYVLNEITAEYERIPGEDGPRLTVSESGDYRLVVKDLVGGSEDQDDVTVSFFESPLIGETDDLFGCDVSVDSIDLTRNEEILVAPNANPEEMEAVYYASSDDLENEIEIINPENYPLEVGSTVYVRVRNKENGCFSEVKQFELASFGFPDIGLPELSIFCVQPNGNLINSVNIGLELGDEYTYQWMVNGELVSEEAVVTFDLVPAGQINLKLTHKSSSCEIELSTQPAPVSKPDSLSVDISGSDFGEGYIVSVVTEGGVGAENASYEFRIDNQQWQNSNQFEAVPPGSHMVSVRETNGCGMVSSEQFFLVGYPRFFTPNSDGYNDTWNLITDENITIKELFVFDRYGKLLRQIPPSGNRGWDGTYNGEKLPADDYWFRVEFIDEKTGELREYMSNFTLIR